VGADYFGVRPCSLYGSLGVDRFVELRKARLHVEALEANRARFEADGRGPLEAMPIRVVGGDTAPATTFAELRALAEPFPAQGIPECADCPISGGRPLGCHRFVHYPVDARFEKALFAYLLAMLGDDIADYVAASDAAGRDLTAGRLLYENLIVTIAEDTPWRTRRGPAEAGGLAALDAPMTTTLADGRALSSAAVLHAAFGDIDSSLALRLYAWLYRDFYRWLESKRLTFQPGSTLAEMRDVRDLLLAVAGQLETEAVGVRVLG
jgi:hypothetical protein